VRRSRRPGLQPEFQRQIMTRFMARKIRAKLLVIALFQNPRRQVPAARELLDVNRIPLKIPLQLRQRQVVSLQRVKSQMGPDSGEHGYEPLLVVFWVGWRP